MITADNASTCVSAISLLCEEAHTGGDYLDWVAQAERSVNVRQYGQANEPRPGEVVSNHILDDIASMTDQQTKEPANKDYECCDTGKPSNFWLRDKPTLRPLTQQEAMEAQATGLYPPGELIEINARIVSKFYQKQCDYRWRMGRLDDKYRKIVLQANTLGFQFPVYEWRNDRKRPRLWTNISLRNIFVDPTADDIEDANYIIIDWIIDAREAEEMFPDFAETIEELSRRGTPQRIDGWTDPEGPLGKIGANVNLNFQRNVVTLRVAHLRNQPMPMTLEEALAQGHVEYRTVPAPMPGGDYDAGDDVAGVAGSAGNAVDAGDSGLSGSDKNPSDGVVGLPKENGATGISQAAEETGESPDPELAGAANETVEPTDQARASEDRQDAGSSQEASGDGAGTEAAVAPTPTRTALLHPASGTEITAPTTNDSGTTATHGKWPMKIVTRRTVVIMSEPEEDDSDPLYRSRIVEDIESPYRTINGSDIPVGFTVGIPVLFKLVGMGLPQKLESLQAGRNRMISAVVQHTDHYRFPIWTMPESVWQVIPDKFKKFGSSLAGAMIRLRDELYSRLQGKILTSITPEPISETTFQAIELMEGDLDQRAAHAQVNEGTPPKGVIGHQAIEALQQAGQAKFNYGSQGHREMLTRIAELHLFSVIDNSSVEDLMESDQTYPEWVVNDIQQWARQSCWAVDVADSTGLGPMKSQQQADAYRKFSTVDRKTGEPVIPMETLRERVGEDQEIEHERWMRSQQEGMQMQMQAAQAQQAANPPPQKQSGKQPARQNGGA